MGKTWTEQWYADQNNNANKAKLTPSNSNIHWEGSGLTLDNTYALPGRTYSYKDSVTVANNNGNGRGHEHGDYGYVAKEAGKVGDTVWAECWYYIPSNTTWRNPGGYSGIKFMTLNPFNNNARVIGHHQKVVSDEIYSAIIFSSGQGQFYSDGDAGPPVRENRSQIKEKGKSSDFHFPVDRWFQMQSALYIQPAGNGGFLKVWMDGKLLWHIKDHTTYDPRQDGGSHGRPGGVTGRGYSVWPIAQFRTGSSSPVSIWSDYTRITTDTALASETDSFGNKLLPSVWGQAKPVDPPVVIPPVVIPPVSGEGNIVFNEQFATGNLQTTGWYDGTNDYNIVNDSILGKNVLEYKWINDKGPTSLRKLINPGLKHFKVKIKVYFSNGFDFYQNNHLIHFTSDRDSKWAGATSWGNINIDWDPTSAEALGRWQDSKMTNSSHSSFSVSRYPRGNNLENITEDRSTGICNTQVGGNKNSSGDDGSCYQWGTDWRSEVFFRKNANSKPMVTGKWIDIEGEIKLNTPGEKNGIYRVYVDNTLVINKDNIEYVTKGSNANIKINQFSIGPHLHASDSGKYVRIGEFVIKDMTGVVTTPVDPPVVIPPVIDPPIEEPKPIDPPVVEPPKPKPPQTSMEEKLDKTNSLLENILNFLKK